MDRQELLRKLGLAFFFASCRGSETVALTRLHSGMGNKGRAHLSGQLIHGEPQFVVSARAGFSVLRQRNRGSHGQGNDLSQTCYE
jgi:hypothetical protein